MELISFGYGALSADLVDVEGLDEAAGQALRADPAGATGYGGVAGYEPLRRWIAERHGVAPERVLVSNGGLQAIGLLLDALDLDAAGPVVMERPTFGMVARAVRGRTANLTGLPVDDDGMDVPALTRLVEGGGRPALVCANPTFQNPTGATMSLPRREALVRLAVEHDLTLLEDDPYRDIAFGGTVPPTMFELSGRADRVIHASSLSKVVCPGMRVGYLVAPEDLVRRIADAALGTYLTPGMFAQAVVYRYLISDRLESALRRLRAILAERARLLAGTLAEELPEARFTVPDGGFFLWVRLPGVDGAALAAAGREEGVAMVDGPSCCGDPDTVRLCFAALRPDDMVEGARRLARAARRAGIIRACDPVR